MKKIVLSVVAAATMCGSAAIAADMPVKARPAPVVVVSPWDWAFGGALMSDYNFRGISQSNRGPSVTAYSELRYNVNSSFQLYLASQYWAVTLPTNPTAEVDIFGGVRVTQGPFALDIGGMYYWYPRERQYAGGAGRPFLPFPNGNVTLNRHRLLGSLRQARLGSREGQVRGRRQRLLLAVLAEHRRQRPVRVGHGQGDAAVLQARLRRWSTKSAGTFRVRPATTGSAPPMSCRAYSDPAIDLPDYATWNVGVAFTWKVATLDLRYYDTNLSKGNCNVLTGDPTAGPGGVVHDRQPAGLQSKLVRRGVHRGAQVRPDRVGEPEVSDI